MSEYSDRKSGAVSPPRAFFGMCGALRGIWRGGEWLADGGAGHVLGAQVVDVAERHDEDEEGDTNHPGVDVPLVGKASANAEPDLVVRTCGPIETRRILCCHGRYSAMSEP